MKKQKTDESKIFKPIIKPGQYSHNIRFYHMIMKMQPSKRHPLDFTDSIKNHLVTSITK